MYESVMKLSIPRPRTWFLLVYLLVCCCCAAVSRVPEQGMVCLTVECQNTNWCCLGAGYHWVLSPFTLLWQGAPCPLDLVLTEPLSHGGAVVEEDLKKCVYEQNVLFLEGSSSINNTLMYWYLHINMWRHHGGVSFDWTVFFWLDYSKKNIYSLLFLPATSSNTKSCYWWELFGVANQNTHLMSQSLSRLVTRVTWWDSRHIEIWRAEDELIHVIKGVLSYWFWESETDLHLHLHLRCKTWE